MLGSFEAVANVAVKDMETAKKFYEGTLGLTPVGGQGDEVVVYQSGSSTMNVYRSDYAGTNKATAVTWTVPDIDAVAKALKAKGVRFEHYDMPDTQLDGDIHVFGEMKVAWFKDPEGNILNLINQ